MTDEKRKVSSPLQWPKELTERANLRELIATAEDLVAGERYDEAIALFEAAHRLFPDSIAIRLNLARVRDLKRRAEEKAYEHQREAWEKEREEVDKLAHHFISLARVYTHQSQFLKALELIELARRMNPNIAEIHHLSARIFYEQMNYERALQALDEARAIDPFNHEIPHLMSRIEMELKRYEPALEHILDAFILSGGEQSRYRELYSEHIRQLARRLNLDVKAVERKLQERKQYFNLYVEQLILKKGQITFEVGPTEIDLMLLQLPRIEQARQSVLGIAMYLRRFSPFRVMTDDQVMAIAKRSSRRFYDPGDYLFREDEPLDSLYLVVEGGVEIVKTTPFGRLVLARMGEGEILGEMDYIDRLQASADAVTNRRSLIISISRNGLAELVLEDRFLGIQLYWHFWKLLADRIRQANELAQKFFKRVLEKPEHQQRDRPMTRTAGERAHVDIDEKLAVLQEKGLSSSELRLLAGFSQEQRYRRGDAIFREGDAGDTLYIILDGQVRISKYISGVGEEALAILDRGEFFGEMALVDGSPRSADAIVHSDEATVISINQRVLTDILSREPESALRFLKILCRMMSKRLREINLKIYQWHLMAGMPIQDS